MPVEGSPFATSHYSNRPAIEAAAGIVNLSVIADLQSQGDATYIANRIEAALSDSDSSIDARFAQWGRAVPTSGAYFKRLPTIGAYLALVYLYRPRALSDANFKGVWKVWNDTANQEIDNICWALGRDSCLPGPTIVPACSSRATLPCLPLI